MDPVLAMGFALSRSAAAFRRIKPPRRPFFPPDVDWTLKHVYNKIHCRTGKCCARCATAANRSEGREPPESRLFKKFAEQHRTVPETLTGERFMTELLAVMRPVQNGLDPLPGMLALAPADSAFPAQSAHFL